MGSWSANADGRSANRKRKCASRKGKRGPEGEREPEEEARMRTGEPRRRHTASSRASCERNGEGGRKRSSQAMKPRGFDRCRCRSYPSLAVPPPPPRTGSAKVTQDDIGGQRPPPFLSPSLTAVLAVTSTNLIARFPGFQVELASLRAYGGFLSRRARVHPATSWLTPAGWPSSPRPQAFGDKVGLGARSVPCRSHAQDHGELR